MRQFSKYLTPQLTYLKQSVLINLLLKTKKRSLEERFLKQYFALEHSSDS
jgi:hypothetical protein